MQKKFIPVFRPQLPSAERLLPYLRQIDSTRFYSNHGPLVLEFEQRLASYLGLPRHGLVSAASGTAALVGAILASAGRAGRQRPLAILPALTFVATAAAVESCGYQPYLADIDPDSWLLDADRLTAHPELDRVGLVVPVATFGRPVPQRAWQTFQQQSGIPVVIDGGASFEGASEAPHDFFGPIPVALSFHATKSFATGEGGSTATTDIDLARRTIQTLNFGFWDTRESRSPSINGKMSEYHAAVGLAELDGWSAKRGALLSVALCYQRLAKRFGIEHRFTTAPIISGCYVLFRCAGTEEKNRIKEALNRHGVDFRLWYGEGLHRQPYLAGVASESLNITNALAPHLLGLPVAPDLTEMEIEHVVSVLAAEIETESAPEQANHQRSLMLGDFLA